MLRGNATMTIEAMVDDMVRSNVEVRRLQLNSGKRRAEETIETIHARAYAWLPKYAAAVRARHPDSLVKLECEGNPQNLNLSVFKRIFMPIGAVEKGFSTLR